MQDAKLLLIKAKGGMGNRMLCLLSGLLYAELSGRRAVVDWCDFAYSDDGANAFHRFFDSPAVDPAVEIPPDATVTPPVWAGRLDRSVSEMISRFDPKLHSSPLIYRKYCCRLNVTDHPEAVAVYWSYVSKIALIRRNFRRSLTRWRGRTDDQVLTDLLREKLRLKPEIERQVETFARATFADPTIAGPTIAGPTIGVHIRHTDRKTPVDRFVREIEKIRDEDPRATVFLATDSRKVERRLKDHFGRVASTEKWFAPDGSRLHQNPTCPDRLQAGIEALLDMYLLARCDYLIYARSSTFGLLAKLLSDMPEQRTIDIERNDWKVRAKALVHQWV